MTLPPLRTGICAVGPLRFPAIVGQVGGDAEELFVCGVPIARFVAELEAGGALLPSWPVTVTADAFSREL